MSPAPTSDIGVGLFSSYTQPHLPTTQHNHMNKDREKRERELRDLIAAVSLIIADNEADSRYARKRLASYKQELAQLLVNEDH